LYTIFQTQWVICTTAISKFHIEEDVHELFHPAFKIYLTNSKDAEVIVRQYSAGTDLWKKSVNKFFLLLGITVFKQSR